MLSGSEFRDLVSGRRRGFAAGLTRAALACAELPYTLAVRLRNRRYDNSASVRRVGVPVVSVGNLTLGGTGKTPLVEWLARWFVDRGVRVALVSRGYGARPGQANDEALELAQSLPGVPHVQNADRVAAAEHAIQQHGAQLILLDDGFQHRRLARDLDLVLVDALEPFGFGHVFPRGTLREPLAGFGRATVVALGRADQISADERAAIRNAIQQHAPQAAWLELRTRTRGLLSAAGQELACASLAGQAIGAFCGIGNPTGFRRQLNASGLTPLGFREFADHHHYSPADLSQLSDWAGSLRADALICTRKDLVKVNQLRLGSAELWALAIETEITAGVEKLIALLEPLAEQALSRSQR